MKKTMDVKELFNTLTLEVAHLETTTEADESQPGRLELRVAQQRGVTFPVNLLQNGPSMRLTAGQGFVKDWPQWETVKSMAEIKKYFLGLLNGTIRMVELRDQGNVYKAILEVLLKGKWQTLDSHAKRGPRVMRQATQTVLRNRPPRPENALLDEALLADLMDETDPCTEHVHNTAITIDEEATPADLPRLLELLQHPNGVVREVVAIPVVRMMGLKALRELLYSFSLEKDECAIQERFCCALFDLTENKIPETLKELAVLANDKDKGVRRAAGWLKIHCEIEEEMVHSRFGKAAVC